MAPAPKPHAIPLPGPHPRACPGGSTGTPRASLHLTRGGRSAMRGSPLGLALPWRQPPTVAVSDIMARLGRYFLPDQPLHVIQRGNNRQAIFFDDADYARF